MMTNSHTIRSKPVLGSQGQEFLMLQPSLRDFLFITGTACGNGGEERAAFFLIFHIRVEQAFAGILRVCW